MTTRPSLRSLYHRKPLKNGGEGGIRTHGSREGSLDFESSPFGQLRHLSGDLFILPLLTWNQVVILIDHLISLGTSLCLALRAVSLGIPAFRDSCPSLDIVPAQRAIWLSCQIVESGPFGLSGASPRPQFLIQPRKTEHKNNRLQAQRQIIIIIFNGLRLY